MAWAKNGTPDTLTGTGSPEITDMTAKKFNMFMMHNIDPSGSAAQDITFNANTNSVYAVRKNLNGGADGTDVSGTAIQVGIGTAVPGMMISYFCSIDGEEKLGVLWYCEQGTAGAGNAPLRREYVYKFVPSPDVGITGIKLDMAGNTYAIGSNLSALGTD
jgi:hypothetical protein